jgi:hypothetical protein
MDRREPVRGEVVEAGLPLGHHDGDIAAHLRLSTRRTAARWA